jgi:cellulose synthase/poly-beta-1,6-N-acetylglucosamine synthase-like glycosyltransferase
VAIVVTFGYLIWRLFGTLSFQWWWLSIPLFVCDLHGAIGLVFYTIGLWDVSPAREPAPGLPKGRVAVLIPTYNEPPEVILPTIAAAVALEPVHETWVLDDGRRGEIRALAAKLGARYLTRPDNLHAKAGNINHALEVVDADIVAVLDADHVPTARFLTATLPYFKDDRIAFVQTPQDFYNHESFEHSHLNGHDFSEEAVFYQAIAPGKNRWGASFWCGTCALLRVEALRSIGGVATESVTEDVHTTIRLYRRGWRGVFRQEVLARGLAPHDAGGYLVQRNRWAKGGMQVLRLENPLRGPGLTLPQRIAFLTSLITWFDSWRTLAYLLIPIAVVITGGVPVSAPAQIFMPLFITTLLLQLAAVRLLTGPVFSLPMSMIFEMVRLPAVLPATLAFILPRRRATFKVTPKGRTGDQRRRAAVPRLLWLLALVSVLSLGWFGLTTAGLTPYRYEVPWPARVASFFVVMNLAILLAAIARIRASRYAGNRRGSVRLAVCAPAAIAGAPCTVLDLSITGARVLLPAKAAADIGEEASLSLLLPDQTIVLRCAVRQHLPTTASTTDIETAAVADATASAEPDCQLGLAFNEGQEQQLARVAVALFHPEVLGDLAMSRRTRSFFRHAPDLRRELQDFDRVAGEPVRRVA